ncbi:MAG: Mur ligase family protein [Patescibacteria group bacterium]|nr:Mur ligase family protein [Patescibacteria group bacterium]
MITSFLLSLIIIFINGFPVLRIYQIKDYLLRRVRAHFFLESSKKFIFNVKEYLLWLIFLLIFILDFSIDKYPTDFLLLILAILLVLRFRLIKKISFTLRATIILAISLVLNFWILNIFRNDILVVAGLSFWSSQFLIFTIASKISYLIAKPYMIWLGNRVKKKLDQNESLKIIGIVGSYGKSTTKELLVQLLRKKYHVLAPPPRINHELALLKFIDKSKLDNYDFLVIEFGSYYLGNVKWITKFITPKIAYITGITKQHLFLFGNIKNIMRGEGIEVLSWMKEGTIFINNNHEYVNELKKEVKNAIGDRRIEIYTYGLEGDFAYKILQNDLERTVFKFKYLSDEIVLKSKIIFPMQIENLCGALAYISKIDDINDYSEVVEKIELPEGFLKLKRIENFYIFDDSYNANPHGVFSSLDFFEKLKLDYKLIIFNGLFELGKETQKIYQELAQKLKSFDKVILTSNDHYEIFRKILLDRVMIVEDLTEMELFLKTLKMKKVGVWIMNRLPAKFNNYFNRFIGLN